MAKIITTPEFDAAFNVWLESCQTLINAYYAKNYTKLETPILTHEHGSKYIKVISSKGFMNASVWAFIDKRNGDVLKPATWKAPARHARGNLFDSNSGLKGITPYGPAYLK